MKMKTLVIGLKQMTSKLPKKTKGWTDRDSADFWRARCRDFEAWLKGLQSDYQHLFTLYEKLDKKYEKLKARKGL